MYKVICNYGARTSELQERFNTSNDAWHYVSNLIINAHTASLLSVEVVQIKPAYLVTVDTFKEIYVVCYSLEEAEKQKQQAETSGHSNVKIFVELD